MTDFSKNRAALLNLKKPKGIIFDWDNTLADTWPLIQTAIDKTMIEMGKEPWGLEKVRDNVHKSMRESFPEIFGNDWVRAGEIYKNSYRSINLEKISLLPNALELINFIDSKAILQFVVSNKIGTTLRSEIKKIGIEKKFFSLIGAQDSDADKPSIKPVELALMGSDLDIKKDEIWFVGDTITDVDCANACGFTPIVYGYFSNGKEQVSKTISAEVLANGFKGNPLPLYFDHQELIDMLKKI
jgi:phosphoglycolate phosphatase